MRPILVSAHNPMTGPRHLGHYASTMAEWPKLQEKYELFVIVDDVIASLLYPAARAKLQDRTIAVVREFMAMDLNPERAHIVLSSMIPEGHELAMFAAMYMDKNWCELLYRESFAGLLTTYQRDELGLPTTPSVAEVVYPQLHLASVTLGLSAAAFQGGEEMRGYMHIMRELCNEMKGLKAPEFVGNNTFIVGTDGMHMATDNAIFISAPEPDIQSKIDMVEHHHVFANWIGALGSEEHATVYEKLSEGGASIVTAQHRGLAGELISRELKRFSAKPIPRDAVIERLERASAVARHRITTTIAELKKDRGLPGFV